MASAASAAGRRRAGSRSRASAAALCAVLLAFAGVLASREFSGFASPVSLRRSRGPAAQRRTAPPGRGRRSDSQPPSPRRRGPGAGEGEEEEEEEDVGNDQPQSTSFEVGDLVRAMSPEDSRWYRGKVEQDNKDGTFRVRWEWAEEGSETHDIEDALINKIFKDYVPGDYVQAISPSSSQWAPADVVRLTEDGTLRVKWEEPAGGDEENDVDLEQVRKIDVFRDYRAGDQVACPSPEDELLRLAIVKQVNADGRVQVQWDDAPEAEEATCDPKHMRMVALKAEVGRKVSCVAARLKDWGAFMELIDGTQGLLHRTQIKRSGVSDMRRYVKMGDRLDLYISEVKPNGQVALTEVEGRAEGRHRLKDISPLQWLDGKVKTIMSWGALVMVSVPDGGYMMGAVHISNVRDWLITDMHEELSVGEKIRVRIEEVDEKTGKINLSMKDVELPKDLEAFAPVAGKRKWLTGKIRKVVDFGLIVKVKSPNGDCMGEGIVISDQMDGAYPLSEYKDGQEVEVRVISIDWGREHLVLSMRQGDGIIQREYLQLFQDLPPNQWLKGEVLEFARFGAYFVRVTAPKSTITVDGMLHISQIEEGYTVDTERVLKQGEILSVRVKDIDFKAGKLSLTMRPVPHVPSVMRDRAGRDLRF